MSSVYAIILAAGRGKRLSHSQPKPFVKLKGKALFEYAAFILISHQKIRETLICFSGGETRQESLFKAFDQLQKKSKLKPDDFVLIHNAVNPFVTHDEITEVIEAAFQYKAAAVAHIVTDTIKEVNRNNRVIKTLDRQTLRALQTPQVIQVKLLRRAITYAQKNKCEGTDDVSLVEFIGIKPKIIPASPYNHKITNQEDLRWARAYVGELPEIRTGFGEDSHRFDRSHRGLKLGGVLIKDYPKLQAHSDGDVILHALCNAIAQTIGEKSIGNYADSMFKDKDITDSSVYLKHILQLMDEKGFKLGNIGISVEGKKPHIDSISDKIKKQLANLTILPVDRIGITAHSGEEMTPFGKGDGIKATAVVTVERK